MSNLSFTLQRDSSTAEVTLGTLTRDDDGGWRCYTLEPSPTRQPFPCIPAGVYDVMMGFSPRFARYVPHVLDVPGRTEIEIHPGNEVTDTHGCIILGMSVKREAGVVQDSREAVHGFVTQLTTLGHGRATLTIHDVVRAA